LRSGASAAWLVARTDAPFRRLVTATAFLSLAVPVIIKSIGWIMLLGSNSGLVNVVLRLLVGGEEGPIALYSLGGMIFVEGMLWMPVVFLLTLPVLGRHGSRRWKKPLRPREPICARSFNT
jgi:iron(III) transport system permease protein